jgi:dienelactone hydrolase
MLRQLCRILPVAGLLLAAAPAARAADFERITIPSADGTQLVTRIAKPRGNGPFPAIVLLHGCGGILNANGGVDARGVDWTDRFVAAGYLVALPDSFGSRNKGSQCAVPPDQQVRPWVERKADVVGLQRWLAQQPNVDRARIALMGWSHGGMTTVFSLNVPGYAAFVALYPACGGALRNRGPLPNVPTLFLLGEADDWTPAGPCKEFAALSPRITMHAYPGAHHQFDWPNMPVRQISGVGTASGRATVGTDSAARNDAIQRVPAFLASALRR